MTEVASQYRAVADGFESRLSRVDPDGWSSASPCQGWSARDVAAHVVNTHRHVRAALGDVTFEEIGVDDDLAAEWASATNAINVALSDETLATKTVGGPFGAQPFDVLVGRLLCADTLIHTWDLARATGQDDRLDDDAVERAMAFLTPIDDVIRRPGAFGPKLDPPPGADAQATLLAFTGRAG